MSTEAKRRGNSAYHARRKEAGMRKLTTWLTPEAQEALQRLSLVHGSQDAAINAALLEASQIKKNIASF